MSISDLLDLAFLGTGCGMLLGGITWIIGFAVSLACNILKKSY